MSDFSCDSSPRRASRHPRYTLGKVNGTRWIIPDLEVWLAETFTMAFKQYRASFSIEGGDDGRRVKEARLIIETDAPADVLLRLVDHIRSHGEVHGDLCSIKPAHGENEKVTIYFAEHLLALEEAAK